MAGILSKIEKIVGAATSIGNIYNKLNSSGLLSGVNLNNIDASNLGSIGSTLQGNISNFTKTITDDISKSIDVSQITGIADSITPSELGLEIPDMSSITSDVEKEMANLPDVGDFNFDASDFDFGDFDLSDLEHISFM